MVTVFAARMLQLLKIELLTLLKRYCQFSTHTICSNLCNVLVQRHWTTTRYERIAFAPHDVKISDGKFKQRGVQPQARRAAMSSSKDREQKASECGETQGLCTAQAQTSEKTQLKKDVNRHDASNSARVIIGSGRDGHWTDCWRVHRFRFRRDPVISILESGAPNLRAL